MKKLGLCALGLSLILTSISLVGCSSAPTHYQIENTLLNNITWTNHTGGGDEAYKNTIFDALVSNTGYPQYVGSEIKNVFSEGKLGGDKLGAIQVTPTNDGTGAYNVDIEIKVNTPDSVSGLTTEGSSGIADFSWWISETGKEMHPTNENAQVIDWDAELGD